MKQSRTAPVRRRFGQSASSRCHQRDPFDGINVFNDDDGISVAQSAVTVPAVPSEQIQSLQSVPRSNEVKVFKYSLGQIVKVEVNGDWCTGSLIKRYRNGSVMVALHGNDCEDDGNDAHYAHFCIINEEAEFVMDGPPILMVQKQQKESVQIPVTFQKPVTNMPNVLSPMASNQKQERIAMYKNTSSRKRYRNLEDVSLVDKEEESLSFPVEKRHLFTL